MKPTDAALKLQQTLRDGRATSWSNVLCWCRVTPGERRRNVTLHRQFVRATGHEMGVFLFCFLLLCLLLFVAFCCFVLCHFSVGPAASCTHCARPSAPCCCQPCMGDVGSPSSLDFQRSMVSPCPLSRLSGRPTGRGCSSLESCIARLETCHEINKKT